MARTTIRSMIDSDYPLAGIAGAVEKPAPGRKASPAAEHVAQHLEDPVGATKEGFEELADKQLQYDLAKENMKRKLAPVEAVIQHVKQTHGLDENQNGIPDEEEGYQDPNQMQPGTVNRMPPQGMNKPGVPPNMAQRPGMMQQNRPGANVNVPGAGPAIAVKPGMQQPVGKPTGQFNPPAARPPAPKKVMQKKPGADKGRSIKVHVSGGAAPGIRPAVGRTQMEAAAAVSNLGSGNKSRTAKKK